MKRKWMYGITALTMVIVAVLWNLRDTLILHLPGLIMELRDPIAPHQEVVWQPGPTQATTPPEARPPNIILIVADDMGHNDVSLDGGGVADGTVPTPNINAIARDGIHFTSGYAGNGTCAPSRAMLMTGRYSTRFGFEFTPAGAAFMRRIHRYNQESESERNAIYYHEREEQMPDTSQLGLPESEITIAELLKKQGYRTLMLGKWHLGEEPHMQPHNRGFDEWLGFLRGASLYAHKDNPEVVGARLEANAIDEFLWANIPYAVQFNGSQHFAGRGYLTEYLTDEAIAAIEANRHRPFFMYLAHFAPHNPLQATREDYEALSHIEDRTERVYAAMIRALDREVGRILDTLKKLGLEDNTLVIFTGDNGGAHYIGLPEINQPYRGWKSTFFEGGIKVPFYLRWPAAIERSSVDDRPVIHADLFTTIARAAGAPLPQDRVIDGVDLLSRTGDEQNATHDALFWHQGHYSVVIADGWKLQRAERPDKVWLFHLDKDPTEQRNLADRHPDKVRELEALLQQHIAEQEEPLWPALLEAPVPIDKTLYEPESPDDEYIYWSN